MPVQEFIKVNQGLRSWVSRHKTLVRMAMDARPEQGKR
jgi:hypothetical protein